MGKKWERFKHLDEAEYWQEICGMTEERLRFEHKIIQQNLCSAGAAAGATGAAGFATCGLAWAGTAIAARRMNVNARQQGLIEKRLKEMGWKGHDFRKRDFAYSVGPCCAAELLIPAGGAVLSHAGQAVTHHAVSTAGQHVAQNASQHAAQVASQHAATQHIAQDLVVHDPTDAMSSVVSHGSTFAHAAVQGVEDQLSVASHGLVGHAAQAAQVLPTDAVTAEAALLGQEAGYVATAEGGRILIHKGVKQGVRLGIGKAIRSQDIRKSKSMTNLPGKDDEIESIADLPGRDDGSESMADLSGNVDGIGKNATEQPKMDAEVNTCKAYVLVRENATEQHKMNAEVNTCKAYVLLRKNSCGEDVELKQENGDDEIESMADLPGRDDGSESTANLSGNVDGIGKNATEELKMDAEVNACKAFVLVRKNSSGDDIELKQDTGDVCQNAQFRMTVSEFDEDDNVVSSLVDMGFSKSAARVALERTNNDVASAVEILINVG